MGDNPNVHPELDAFYRRERELFRSDDDAVTTANPGKTTPTKAAVSFSDILSARKRKLGQAFRDADTHEESITPVLPPRKFIVGLDYGTTFTSVSYAIHDIADEHPRILPWDVMHISN